MHRLSRPKVFSSGLGRMTASARLSASLADPLARAGYRNRPAAGLADHLVVAADEVSSAFMRDIRDHAAFPAGIPLGLWVPARLSNHLGAAAVNVHKAFLGDSGLLAALPATVCAAFHLRSLTSSLVGLWLGVGRIQRRDCHFPPELEGKRRFMPMTFA